MATNNITWQGGLIRFVIALGLVFFTYNPQGWSYFHWVQSYLSSAADSNTSLPLLVFAGVVLTIAWAIYIRATMRSLGLIGLILAVAFFAALFWLIVDFGLIPVGNPTVLINLALVIFSGVLAVGISWSHMRRKITGQSDVDDIDQ